MSIFSFFKRKPEPVNAYDYRQTIPEQKKDSRANLTIKGADDLITEVRDGLAFVKDRQRLNSKAEAIRYLIRKYREHAERQLRDEGIVTIKPAKKPQEVIVEQTASLPVMPRVSLANKEEVQHRIDICRKTLESINADGLAWRLWKDWNDNLEAQERLMVLLDSGLPLVNRKTHGVLVNHKHYYRLGPAKAKMDGSAAFVPMDVQAFVASAKGAA